MSAAEDIAHMRAQLRNIEALQFQARLFGASEPYRRMTDNLQTILRLAIRGREDLERETMALQSRRASMTKAAIAQAEAAILHLSITRTFTAVCMVDIDNVPPEQRPEYVLDLVTTIQERRREFAEKFADHSQEETAQ